jgi:hypothetical protein
MGAPRPRFVSNVDIASLCALVLIVSVFTPWAEGQGNMDTHAVTLAGYSRPEGWLLLVIGLIAVGSARYMAQHPQSVHASLVLLLVFGLASLLGADLLYHGDRLRVMTGGGVRIEGWVWFQLSWGLPLSTVTSLAGFAASVRLVAAVLATRAARHSEA